MTRKICILPPTKLKWYREYPTGNSRSTVVFKIMYFENGGWVVSMFVGTSWEVGCKDNAAKLRRLRNDRFITPTACE